MKFIIGYPEITGSAGDLLDSGDMGPLAAASEKAGWEGFALTEHPIPGARWLDTGGHQTIDPFIGLSFAAAATERIKLLTYLTVVPYRNPFMLAKIAATLDRLSHGRLILGVGTGYQKSEYFALGIDIDERNALFDEALEVMPLAWKGEPFSYKGIHFDARDVIAKPVPAQNPIPIWIGGNAKLTLRRVAAKAQGWMPLSGPPELAVTAKTAHIATMDDLRIKIDQLKEDAGGRHIDIAHSYIDWSIRDLGVDVERHRQTIAEYADAGIEWIHVEAPAGTPSQVIEWAQGFGETYITAK
ncbi:MAG: LLM class F420-dependent oxidoreductase [Acidimicrobiia bacterium]